MNNPLFMVFDVESIGLHGEAFAAAYVVVNAQGKILNQACFSCPPEAARGSDDSRLWVATNVPPIGAQFRTPREVRAEFWRRWVTWKSAGATLVADCAWPVEARFLAAAVDDDPHVREWAGPYPLIDLSSVLLARGRDPLATGERLPDELPAHHPLADAKQSARLLVECLFKS